MHRFPSRESRKPKSLSPIDITRPRSLSALQPPHASSVVKKVLSLKGSGLFVDTTWRALCDKPADSTRPRRNTSPTEPAWPKDITTPAPDRETLSAPAPSTSTFELALPIGSLLFSPMSSTLSDNMESPRSSVDQPEPSKGSPERCDSGYASAAGASPTVPRTPRSSARLSGGPLTPGGMSMRLSPTVPRPVMPMPILNLPPLPPAPISDHTLPRTRGFQPGEMRHVRKSMPVFMRHGTNQAVAHAEEGEEDDVDADDDDADDSSEDSDDSSDTEETVPADGDTSPEPQGSINESIDECAEHSEGETTDYFDACDTHTPGPLEDSTAQGPSGLVTPRASGQIPALVCETSALGIQIPSASRPSTISSSSPWTLVDHTPGADRAANGHPSRIDYFSHPVAAARQAFKSPHRTPRVAELLSLASPSRVNASTPRATPNPPLTTDTIAERRARASTVHRDPNGESPRPTLYHQVSQSMMNLSSPPPALGMVLSELDVVRSPLCSPLEGKSTIPATPVTPGPPPTPLMRRNSMPTMIKHPPNYKDLFPSVPREEEGKEKLPTYSCGVHIEGMMPRKMEFSAPGVLAKDRGWKKQYIVLHGTTLSVYKNDVRKFPIGGKVKGKKYEGVVTESEVDLSSPTVHLPGYESTVARNPPTRRSSRIVPLAGTSENGSRSSLLSRFHGSSSKSAAARAQESASSGDKANSSSSAISLSGSSSTIKRRSHHQSSGSFASLSHFNPPFSSGNALVRQYTLQRAESGLGSDYYKRRNVIRVRCEGEQFLLQADNVMQVVDWIECLQAGANVALDLDERPMTKPPPFPRRRRRRRVRPVDGAGTSEAARDVAASGAGANGSNDNANH